MKKNLKFVPLLSLYISCPCAQDLPANIDQPLQNILQSHYHQYKDLEYFSGGSLSVYIPNQPIKNYYIGRISQNSKSHLVDKNTLFQIGSITKSFTSSLVLQLVKENKLKLADSLKAWLPQYNKWENMTINQLLNMSSGIPDYTQSPLLDSQIYYNLSRIWTDSELVQFAYPPANFNPPLKSGFFYSNTNYILASMIIEKAAKNTYEHEINNRLIQPTGLTNTFYILKRLAPKLQNRMAYGYFYDPYRLAEMVGKDIYEGNLSFAAAAGGIISNSEDMIKWVKALFIDNKILDSNQKKQLLSLISTANGEPLSQVSSVHPHGFGLGVSEKFENDVGRYWFYEGKTIGFRAIYMYKPCNGIIISAVFNSATNEKNDHIGRLLQQVYHTILSQNPQLQCQDTEE